MREINEAGLKLIKEFEGCSLTAYRDVGGILTIGFGHVDSHIVEGQKITQGQAGKLLLGDLVRVEIGVTNLTPPVISDNEFSALVSLVYNIGINAFNHSTLLENLHSGDLQGAANQFLRWNKVNGKVVDGLTRRRQAEKDLFETPIG